MGVTHSYAPEVIKQGTNGRTTLTAHLASKPLLIYPKQLPLSHSPEIMGKAAVSQGPIARAALFKIPELPTSVPLEVPKASSICEYEASLQVHICRCPKKFSLGSEGLPEWDLDSKCSINMLFSGLDVFSYQTAVPGHAVAVLFLYATFSPSLASLG